MSRLAWDRSQLVRSGAISLIAGKHMPAGKVVAPMAVGGSPAVARYRLRVVLREAREAKGLTQRQVADALDWSLSKVNRIESGEVSVTTTDVRALLDLYEIMDPDQVQGLLQQARTARQRSWWDQQQFREHLPTDLVETFQFETEATEIRTFQPTVVPGVLQTRAYADAILQLWRDEHSDAYRTALIESRSLRHDRLFGRSDPPLYLLALDESVLMRSVGGPAVLSEQLYSLLNAVDAGQVTVRVVPFAHMSGYAAAWNMFTIYTLGEENVLVYREYYSIVDNTFSKETIKQYRQRFDQLWEHSLTPEASVRLIEARAAHYRAEAELHT